MNKQTDRQSKSILEKPRLLTRNISPCKNHPYHFTRVPQSVPSFLLSMYTLGIKVKGESVSSAYAAPDSAASKAVYPHLRVHGNKRFPLWYKPSSSARVYSFRQRVVRGVPSLLSFMGFFVYSFFFIFFLLSLSLSFSHFIRLLLG